MAHIQQGPSKKQRTEAVAPSPEEDFLANLPQATNVTNEPAHASASASASASLTASQADNSLNAETDKNIRKRSAEKIEAPFNLTALKECWEKAFKDAPADIISAFDQVRIKLFGSTDIATPNPSSIDLDGVLNIINHGAFYQIYFQYISPIMTFLAGQPDAPIEELTKKPYAFLEKEFLNEEGPDTEDSSPPTAEEIWRIYHHFHLMHKTASDQNNAIAQLKLAEFFSDLSYSETISELPAESLREIEGKDANLNFKQLENKYYFLAAKNGSRIAYDSLIENYIHADANNEDFLEALKIGAENQYIDRGEPSICWLASVYLNGETEGGRPKEENINVVKGLFNLRKLMATKKWGGLNKAERYKALDKFRPQPTSEFIAYHYLFFVKGKNFTQNDEIDNISNRDTLELIIKGLCQFEFDELTPLSRRFELLYKIIEKDKSYFATTLEYMPFTVKAHFLTWLNENKKPALLWKLLRNIIKKDPVPLLKYALYTETDDLKVLLTRQEAIYTHARTAFSQSHDLQEGTPLEDCKDNKALSQFEIALDTFIDKIQKIIWTLEKHRLRTWNEKLQQEIKHYQALLAEKQTVKRIVKMKIKSFVATTVIAATNGGGHRSVIAAATSAISLASAAAERDQSHESDQPWMSYYS